MVPLLKSSKGTNLFGLEGYPEQVPSLNQADSVFSEDLLIGSLASRKFPQPGRISYLGQDISPTPGYATTPGFAGDPQITGSGGVPVYVIIVAPVVFLAMSAALLYYLCRCMARRKKRENQLASLTPRSKDAHMLVGVRANQPIQFVVPTTIMVNENTEDSVSETDYSSGGPNRTLPIILDRRNNRKRTFSGFHINPDDLQHGLYVGVKAASDSKGAFLGDLGKVGFSLSYDPARHRLTVMLIGASDLPCHFLKTTANPCTKIVLLPDRTPKYVSKVQRNTTNPTFDESFAFHNVTRADLLQKKLKISVWDYDKFSRKCLLGQVVYSVSDAAGLFAGGEQLNSRTGDIWVDLKPEVSSHSSGAAEMLFSLCYNPDTANLTLTVLKIRGLITQHDKAKDLSVYAKVTLYVRRKMVRTKKTPSRRKTPEVEFDRSSFDIHVPHQSLGDVDLLVTVCEKGPGLSPRRVLGRAQVGGNCLCDQGLQHWQDMLLSPKSTSAHWHVLCG